MERIRLPRITHGKTAGNYDPENPDDPGQLVADGAELRETIHHNMQEIMRCALDIDNHLAEIISFYFRPADQARADLFQNWIAHSSSLSFKSKFDIVMAILDTEENLRPECELKKLTEHFRRVMMFRNAFAHGKLVRHRPENTFRIHHFHGKPESHEIDEARIKKIETSCRELFMSLSQVLMKIAQQLAK